MESIMQTAQQHNEEHGENTAGTNSNELSPQQEEWQQQWEDEWQEQQQAELMDAFNTKNLKCLALMVNYVYSYLKLANEHKIGDISMSACDAHGMQALALATSTTIMYCPEGMAQLSTVQLTRLGETFFDILDEASSNSSEHAASNALKNKLDYIIDRLSEGMQQFSDNLPTAGPDESEASILLKYIIEFFRPRYIIPQSLKIAQEMEALGCNG
jgi:hypothetical protein